MKSLKGNTDFMIEGSLGSPFLAAMLSSWGQETEDNGDNKDNEDIPYYVQARLDAYTWYEKGSVIWTHPKLAPEGLICSQTLDPEDPSTYTFPTPRTGQITSQKYEWGLLHSIFETLFKNGWLVEPHKIVITL